MLKVLVRKHSPGGFTFYVPPPGCFTIWKDKVEVLCRTTKDYQVVSPRFTRAQHERLKSGIVEKEKENLNVERDWRPLILFIPTLLNANQTKISDLKINALKEILKFPQSLGIVGGKPNGSLYFVAFQDDNLFYLNPHIVQPSVPLGNFTTETFSVNLPQTMKIREIDPSLALGFYCKDKNDFEDLCDRINYMNSKMENDTIVDVAESTPKYAKKQEPDPIEDIIFPPFPEKKIIVNITQKNNDEFSDLEEMQNDFQMIN